MNLLPYLKTINKLKQLFIVVFLIVIYYSVTFPTSMREVNLQKETAWNKLTSKEIVSLVILITTGDEKYKNSKLNNLFKETQIIHLLVISGSNIIVFLQFINIFILRKKKINYVISIILISIYLKYTGFPQTLIRALISFSLSEILSINGLRFSTIAFLFVLISFLGITFIVGKLGISFYLSATYSIAIIIFNRIILKEENNSRLTRFFVFNVYITAVSYFMFYNYHNFSSCTSFVANIFITAAFEPAILTSYVVYFLPAFTETNVLAEIADILFIFLENMLIYIGFIRNLTYNICYE